jgi:hypothetical protein
MGPSPGKFRYRLRRDATAERVQNRALPLE